MNRVLDRLYIGDTFDLDEKVPLHTLGFRAVLDLRDGAWTPPKTVVDVLRLQNRDGDPWNAEQITGALDFIGKHVQAGKVLVACAAGMSRSASMVIGYLVRGGMDAAAAYALVREARPQIVPVPVMLASVLRVVGA